MKEKCGIENRARFSARGFVYVAVLSLALAGTSAPADGVFGVRLHGELGRRLDQMIERHVLGVNPDYLTDVFKEKTERQGWWQTEFWGKYMHSAVPFWRYSGNALLKERIDRGVRGILSSQEPCGYIGNYPDDLRCRDGWDVWGMKYTMLGLLHYYDETKSREALESCRRLCDYLIGELGENGRRGCSLIETGNQAGMASGSVLEPVVWLYNRTRETRYLDFATLIVRQLDDPKTGPELLRNADVPVYLRQDPSTNGFVWSAGAYKTNRRKAYEMMSCYQGLLEYYEATGRKDCLDAAVKTSESIIRDELNLAGGAACSENWFHGGVKQHKPYSRLQETCVTITWLRLCEKLLALTGHAKYADEMERTFYNAYLGALKPDGSEFEGYTPLNGTRYHGQHHCFMHTDCCTANGPRGFLSFLRAFFTATGDSATFSQYASASVTGELSGGRRVAFDMYARYPILGMARVVSHTEGCGRFPLRFRIPSWCEKASFRLNGEEVAGEKRGGTYFAIDHEWALGDVVEIEFEMLVKAHVTDHHVAFTYGPILLARDTRFADGDLSEQLPRVRPKGRTYVGIYRDGETVEGAAVVRSPSDDIWLTVSVPLPLGLHHENPFGQLPQAVKFCDFASAGNTWTPGNLYRTWIPIELEQDEE